MTNVVLKLISIIGLMMSLSACSAGGGSSPPAEAAINKRVNDANELIAEFNAISSELYDKYGFEITDGNSQIGLPAVKDLTADQLEDAKTKLNRLNVLGPEILRAGSSSELFFAETARLSNALSRVSGYLATIVKMENEQKNIGGVPDSQKLTIREAREQAVSARRAVEQKIKDSTAAFESLSTPAKQALDMDLELFKLRIAEMRTEDIASALSMMNSKAAEVVKAIVNYNSKAEQLKAHKEFDIKLIPFVSEAQAQMAVVQSSYDSIAFHTKTKMDLLRQEGQ